MQPAAAAQDGTGVRLTKGTQADGAAMLNHETFWTQNLKNVSVDQVCTCAHSMVVTEGNTRHSAGIFPQVLFSKARESQGERRKGW